MTTFTMTHELDCDQERFWTLFFDNELNHAIFAHLEFPEWTIVEERDDAKEHVRIVKATPKIELPAAVQKLLGASFGYTEEGRLDKATSVWHFDVKPSTMASKLINTGTVKCEPAGPGKCKRITEMFMEAKVFGLGGIIESSMERGSRIGWGKSATFINQWIGSH